MTTRDKIATSSITYKTIGWTIKRYNGGIGQSWNECAFLPLSSLNSFPDPEDSRYCYTTFYCDKNTIYNAIGEVSADWQESLYRNGGTVYLDAIMTVCYQGVPQGRLIDSKPTTEGRVYFYFDDIAKAEHWSDTSGLYSHYNKVLTFPANPILLKETTCTVKHMEIASDSQNLTLQRYGKDHMETHRNWSEQTFAAPDFSSHFFSFDHTQLQITYYDGTQEFRSYSSKFTLKNPNQNIAGLIVTHYYKRTISTKKLSHRYLLSDTDALQTHSGGCVTASNSNSETYDVTKGIPGQSYVNLQVAVSPFAYQADYCNYFGEFTCAIPIRTSYTLVWSEGGTSRQERVTLLENYYVDRPFSFYLLTNYSAYLLRNVTVTQSAFENPTQYLSPPTPVTCNVSQNNTLSEHYQLPNSATLTVDGGTLHGNGQRPPLPSGAMQTYAEKAVGNILVKNDSFQIGDTVILSNSSTFSRASAPVLPPEDKALSLEKKDLLIPFNRKNHPNYATDCFAVYAGIPNQTPRTKTFSLNAICVHTPVVCNTQISNSRDKNQQISPNNALASLILGESFTVQTSMIGEHLDLPGYGKRDYSTYASKVEACFPFPVYLGDTLLKENQWHTISKKENLYLPTAVPEGAYQIAFRVSAKNTPSDADYDSLCEDNANLDLTHTIATRTIPVFVIGRLYGLNFSVNGHTYPVGNKDKNGILLSDTNASQSETFPAAASLMTLPLSRCSYFSRLPFRITTIGNPPDDFSFLCMEPTFYHVDENGQNRRPVDLYYLSKNNTISKYDSKLLLYPSCVSFCGTTDKNAGKTETATHSVQIWNSVFSLDKPLFIVPSDSTFLNTLKEKGSLSLRDSFFLKDGFLIVNFSITYKRKTPLTLSYINSANAKNGYCNMWKTEGFSYTRTDSKQNTWQFIDGDTLIFSVKDNHRVYTSH